MKDEENQFLQQLWADYKGYGPSSAGVCARLSPIAESVRADSLQIEGDDVSFSASFLIGSTPGYSYAIEPRVHFSLEQTLDIPSRLPPGKGRASYPKGVTLDNLGEYQITGYPESILPRCLFSTPSDDRLPANVAVLVISEPVNERLHRLANTFQGFPQHNSEGYWRMLYLSASTITTSGFGDIVPLTKTARIWVTSESIVGVVLIGLFLNGLSRRPAHK